MNQDCGEGERVIKASGVKSKESMDTLCCLDSNTAAKGGGGGESESQASLLGRA